jgi:asparagine synthase (glutamine-hydrolysing)
MPKTYGIEKYLLRKSFDLDDLLPSEVLWRVKEGMSDGVSSKTKSWFEIIQDLAAKKYNKDNFEEAKA